MLKSDKAKEIMDGVSQSVAELEKKIESPETEQAIRDWLKFQAQFHQYSFRNTYWLQVQSKHRGVKLEQVASFAQWAKMKSPDGDKVQIKKGEKGFGIIFPFNHTAYKRDGDGNFATDKEGKKIPELNEDNEPQQFIRFGHGYVFDVSQTNAKEIGAYHEFDFYGKTVEIDHALIENIADGIKNTYGVPVNFVNAADDRRDGFYDPRNNSITINAERENFIQLGTLFHELGHSIMHGKGCKLLSREAEEGQAEAFAYAASIPFGIELKSELYIKDWIRDKVPLEDALKDIGKRVKEAYEKLGLAELAAVQAALKVPAATETVLESEKIIPESVPVPDVMAQMELGM